MRYALILFMTLLLAATVFLWAAPAGAQSDALMEAVDRHKALKEQGKYAEAEPFALKALELGEREFGAEHLSTAGFLYILGGPYQDQGRWGVAKW